MCTDDGGAHPNDTENHNQAFHSAAEDRSVLNFVEGDIAEPIHHEAGHQHGDDDNVAAAKGVADIRLEEKQGNDEDHGKQEDDDGNFAFE